MMQSPLNTSPDIYLYHLGFYVNLRQQGTRFLAPVIIRADASSGGCHAKNNRWNQSKLQFLKEIRQDRSCWSTPSACSSPALSASASTQFALISASTIAEIPTIELCTRQRPH